MKVLARVAFLLLLPAFLGLGLMRGGADAAPARVAASLASTSAAAPPYGISEKRPVFAGACKACPWGILAMVARDAMAPYGYAVQVCWSCGTVHGPREVGDRTKAEPVSATSDRLYVDPAPDAVPDFGATSQINLEQSWQGVGRFAGDNKKRQNYRVIAALQQPNYLIVAATQKSGITDLGQIKDRAQPTWIAIDNNEATQLILKHYGLTADALKAKGGGILQTSQREKRASADIFISNGLLVNTPEQRMWYEVSQLNDLAYLTLDDAVQDEILKLPGYVRATMPLAILRGVNHPIPTVMRSTHYIYARDDAPDTFAYAVAKALDEHQELFRLQAEPWYYDPRLVAQSPLVPMHPGAMKYYRERGYIR